MKHRAFVPGALLASAALITASLATPLWAQPAQKIVGQAIYHDTSPRISHLPPNNPGQGGGNRQIPNKQRVKPARFPDLAEPDGGVQSQASGPAQLGPTPGPIVSAPGLSEDNNALILGYRVVPPDINGDIGLDASGNRIFIQYINSIWGVFNASGSLIAGPYRGNTFWAGFGGYCQTNNDGDPIVLYDAQAGRWVFSQFSIDEGIQCVAVSTTRDPLGPYYRYAFIVTPGRNNDYPKLGVWADGTTGSSGQSAYTFTTRDFPNTSSSFMGTGVMERDQMLVGGPAKFIKFENPCVTNECIEGQLPPHLAGSPPPAGTCPTFWTAVDAAYDDSPWSSDGYRNHKLCVNWSNLANSTYTEGPLVVAGSNFNRNLGNISPVNGGENLNSLPYFTMYRAPYRWFGSYGSVVLNTTVDADSARAGIRWAEVRSADGATGWFRQQDGTFAPADGLERWMGSIAQDRDGNIALGYSVTGSNLFPSVRYTSRMAGDAAGTMPGGEVTCIAGTGAQAANSYNRWGDYSSMSVDPTDDCTFWYTQEYYETTGSFDFNTRICSFKISGCGGSSGNTPPTAGFSYVCTGLACTFTDGSTDPGGSIASRSWNFGDTGTSTLPNPSHTYAAGGTYSVTLTVTDNGGLSDPETKSVTVTSGSTLVGSSTNNGKTWTAKVTDTRGSSFTLTGTWSVSGSGSCSLNICTRSGLSKKTASVIFTQAVTGTKVTVLKP